MRNTLRCILRGIVTLFGLSRLLFTILFLLDRRQRVVVLVYHRILSCAGAAVHGGIRRDNFEDQVRFLCKLFRLVTPDEAAQILSGREKNARQGWRYPLLLTFDDGYKNNMRYAVPVLRQYRAPGIIFLTTGHIGQERLLWPDEVKELMMTCPHQWLELPYRGEVETWPLYDLDTRLKTADALKRRLKRLGHQKFVDHLQDIRDAACVSNLDHHEGSRLLSWHEAKSLQQRGITMGSHTAGHYILSRLPERLLEIELTGSQAHLETHLGDPSRFLAYPNGQPDDYDRLVIEKARQAGFKLAFTMTPLVASETDDPMALPRIPPQDESGASLGVTILRTLVGQMLGMLAPPPILERKARGEHLHGDRLDDTPTLDPEIELPHPVQDLQSLSSTGDLAPPQSVLQEIVDDNRERPED